MIKCTFAQTAAGTARSLIVVGSLVIVVLAALGAEGTNRQTLGGPTATHPGSTTSKAAVAAYPSTELIKACEQEAKELKGRLDDTFAVTVSAPFVVAGNVSLARARQYISGCVTGPARAMWHCYFSKKPDEVIAVLLFADDESYRGWAKKLFDDKDVSHYGYYKPDKRTLVMNIDTGGGTLVHELTHSLIVYDFPSVPQWFNEGLASLHEQSHIAEDRVVGMVNWRLPALEKAIADGKLRPLADMISKNDFYDEKTRGINYAQSRYFFMYLQEKKLIDKLYTTMRDNHKDTEGDVKLVEQVLGKKIGDIEADYIEYVKTLKWRP